jgi:serine/threonine protein phosphatase PrpC
MLERLKLVYDLHPWMRRVSWGLLAIAGVGIYLIPGGFPPRAWVLLFAVIPQLAQLWERRGSAIMLPVALLALQSLTWLIAWGLFIGACSIVIRLWTQAQHERKEFEADLHKAHDDITEEQEALPWSPLPLPVRQKPPLVLTNTFEKEQKIQKTPTHSWQRQLSLHLNVGIGWDVGTARKHKPNEDSLVAFEGTCIYNCQLLPFGLFVVADGMGGYAHGQDASYLAIQTVLQSLLPNIVGSEEMTDDILIDVLVQSVKQANLAVLQRSQEVNAEMGATITAALVMDKTAFVVNVGDSRTYHYRECKGLSQVTRDHSHVARLVAAGQIARDDIYTHPDRNQVYRGLGAESRVKVDRFSVPLQANDCLLLCSDGLWEMVRDPEIEQTLKEMGSNPSQASKALVRAALKGGGLDNISVIVVHVAPTTV